MNLGFCLSGSGLIRTILLTEGSGFRYKVTQSLVQKLVTEIKYVDVLENGDTICQKQIFLPFLFHHKGNDHSRYGILQKDD